MYNIPAPRVDDANDYEQIRLHRRSPAAVALTRIWPQVEAAYSHYRAQGDQIGTIKTSTKISRADAKIVGAGYDSMGSNQPCEFIRNELKALTKNGVCPYCGLNDATQLDHILEKVDFPEYAILRMNLVAVCQPCNGSKEARKSRRPAGTVFHIYIHGFPLDPFLDVSICLTRVGLRIQFAPRLSPNMSVTWQNALAEHFRSTGVAPRYAQRALSELSDRRVDMEEAFERGIKAHLETALGPVSQAESNEAGGREVGRFLLKAARNLAKSRGATWWVVALLEAAGSSKEFCMEGFRRV